MAKLTTRPMPGRSWEPGKLLKSDLLSDIRDLLNLEVASRGDMPVSDTAPQ